MRHEFIQIIGTLPHSDFGDPECCGCLNGFVRESQVDLVCNKCDEILQTVPAVDLERSIRWSWRSISRASFCPHCGVAHLAPEFSQLLVFVCDQGGEAVKLPEPRPEN